MNCPECTRPMERIGGQSAPTINFTMHRYRCCPCKLFVDVEITVRHDLQDRDTYD